MRQDSVTAAIGTRLRKHEREAFDLAASVVGLGPSALLRLAMVEWLRREGWIAPTPPPFAKDMQ